MVASSPLPSAERPERSRNAKAQARHRAKRKAYIQQLETSVAKLQAVVGLPSADGATPTSVPISRVRELEEENARLRAENDALRKRLADSPIDDGEISASTSAYGYDDRTATSPRRTNSFYSPTTSGPRGFSNILAEPADGASRTSSHSSLASLAPAPSLTHSAGSLPDSPTSSHSAGSPLTAASPLQLPGLRLPGSSSALGSPHAYGTYTQQATSPTGQQEQSTRTATQSGFARSPYPPLPPISTPSSALPTFADYFSSGQYVKNEEPYSSAYQGAYQQQSYASSYGTTMSYGMVPSDISAWSAPASRR